MSYKLSQFNQKTADKILAQIAKEDAGKSKPEEPARAVKKSDKRIRQGEKTPNKLEADWRKHLESVNPEQKFRAQSIRFRIANGAWYKPDLISWHEGRVICWETKGPKQMKGVARGVLTIKVAAGLWPEVRFILVWREEGVWKKQVVLP